MDHEHDLLDGENVPTGERPIYVVRLQPTKHVLDPVRVLRWALKRLGRDCGMRALSVEEEQA